MVPRWNMAKTNDTNASNIESNRSDEVICMADLQKTTIKLTKVIKTPNPNMETIKPLRTPD